MRRRTRRAAQGFTLMELIVAAMLSMLVIAGLYVVYATHTRVFRSQESVSQAQFGVRFAMETVLADLQRAGYQGVPSTTQPQIAQRLCANSLLPAFQAVTLVHGDGEVVNPSKNPNVTGDMARPPQTPPDTLTLVGNFANDDVFWADRLVGATITLQDTSAIDRTDPFPRSQEAFDEIFRTDGSTLIRIRNQDKTFFSPVASASFAAKTVTLAHSPSCADQGLWSWGEVNVLHRVRYAVVNPATTGLLTSVEVANLTKVPGLNERRDLVREYLTWDNPPTVVRREVIAENVVDFQVWFLFDQVETPDTGPMVDQVAAYSVDENQVGGEPCNATSDSIGGNSNCEPWNIHGAIVRISVRTPAEDPNWPVPPDDVPRQPLRYYELNEASVGSARVRTLVSQVEMPNLGYGR